MNKTGKSPPGLSKKINDIVKVEEELELDFILADLKTIIAESLAGADRIKEIVADLKDFVRPGEDEAQLADINRCLDTILNVIGHMFKGDVEVVRRYGDLPKVMCQPRQLNQAFMNILVNAVQAIEGKGEIRIVTLCLDDWVEIAISDTGAGMTDEVISRACEPFFTTREVGRGRGLGLNVAHNIVSRHGGTIDIASRIGKGTTLSVRIPVDGPDER